MIGTFTEGQRVRVYPHGSPEQAAIGIVALISGNQRSIAIGFDGLPPFAFQQMPLVGVHPELWRCAAGLSRRGGPVDRARRWRPLRDRGVA